MPSVFPGSLGAIVRSFKSAVTRSTGSHIWQRNYYEHVIRNEPDLNRIRQYIVGNPAKWDDDEYNPVNASA